MKCRGARSPGETTWFILARVLVGVWQASLQEPSALAVKQPYDWFPHHESCRVNRSKERDARAKPTSTYTGSDHK
jgi:hypothetical protein